jgi:hypothetical protein
MKMRIHFSNQTGNVLLVSLIFSAVFGLSLAAYLSLVGTQYRASGRSQAWNMALPVAEAGIEEALALISMPGDLTNNMIGNGWTLSGSTWNRTQVIQSNRYTITLSNITASLPDVYSKGQVLFESDNNWISRTIKLTLRRTGLLSAGMLAKGVINMNGNGVGVDSFDSTDPNYSVNGAYNSAKRKDNGNVMTILGTSGALDLGNANIYGYAGVGPGGSASVGPNGGIGSFAFQAAHSGQIEAARFRTDVILDFPDVEVPFSSPWSPQVNVKVGNTTYDYYLANGNYGMSSLDLKGRSSMYIAGNARLLVNGGISLGGQSSIIIASGASLHLYSNGTVDLSGNGVANNNGNATNCFIYGLQSCTSITLSGNGTLCAVVYAPYADFSLKGGGGNAQDFCGAVVANTVTMNGHFNFHYDEALGKLQNLSHLQITSWQEVPNAQ